jgi:hypothetical protein
MGGGCRALDAAEGFEVFDIGGAFLGGLEGLHRLVQVASGMVAQVLGEEGASLAILAQTMRRGRVEAAAGSPRRSIWARRRT